MTDKRSTSLLFYYSCVLTYRPTISKKLQSYKPFNEWFVTL